MDERILREDSLGTAATTGQYLAEVTYVKQVYTVRAHGIQRLSPGATGFATPPPQIICFFRAK
ncbi:hypothetical protein [uncultured Muribaculum sp.]|uniref:hypothetical protein n=1 Tax=uncultured Muribaculum sp. TaxID=1918613 RepID=UPI0025A9C473|nr:hypothetical protein [uncultured Muribaculum sp.]